MTPVRVGLLGLGVVGAQVAALLGERRALVSERAGGPVELAAVLVRDLAKQRAPLPEGVELTNDPSRILDDPDIRVVIEVMGGMEPARTDIERALVAGKAVVTANKEVMAHHCPDLLALAWRHGVDIGFEAAVGAAIPLISTLRSGLLANRITRIEAVINGTTNYILERMQGDGASFERALAEAQRLGIAEADPAYDVDGHDAAFKLAIMATLAFGARIEVRSVAREGIRGLDPVDLRYADELGYVVRLVACAGDDGDEIELRVQPCLVPRGHPLAVLPGALNAVVIEGDVAGTIVLYGAGAGGRPTAGAVVGDVIEVVRSLRGAAGNRAAPDFSRRRRLRNPAEALTAGYLRLHVADRPGVPDEVTRILGEHQVSVAAHQQKAIVEAHAAAEMVVLTHPAAESRLQSARAQLLRCDAVYAVPTLLHLITAAPV